MGEENVKVSVLMLTYNHERYLAQAIEGVLMQRTHFPYELVIAEDCSTDRTRDVIRQYWEKYPDRIRVFLNRHNIKGRRTVVRGYNACRGQYVAYVEGDDYWTCPDKLQRQADLLDRRPDCSICFHSVTMMWDDERHEPTVFRPNNIQDTYVLEDLLETNFIGACSPMYRKGVFGDFPAWHFLPPVGDWSVHIMHAHHGKIAYIDEPMGVYRQHSGGIYSSRPASHRLKVAIECFLVFRDALDHRYRRLIARELSAYYLELARTQLKEGDVSAARDSVQSCILESVSGGRWLGIPLVRTLVEVHLPGLHKWARRMCRREILGRS